MISLFFFFIHTFDYIIKIALFHGSLPIWIGNKLYRYLVIPVTVTMIVFKL